MLTGIIPVAEVDRHYTDDRLDLWGAFTQIPGTAVANRLGACSLVPQVAEVLVHKIEARYIGIGQGQHPFHLFTPLQAYAPTAINAALVLPWMQPVKPGQPGRLSSTIFVTGETDAGLMVVTVNGAPHTAIGPAYTLSSQGIALVAAPFSSHPTVLWGFQDPPLRVKPGQQLTVQATAAIPLNFFLNVNWFYSERVFQGDVG